MASQEPFSKHEKLLRSMAYRVTMRMHSAGAASAQQEDVFQEMVIAWCQARDAWNPELGVPFGAYLVRGVSHHINRWADREIRQRKLAPFDLDAPVPGSEGGREVTRHDMIGDELIAAPDEALIAKDLREHVRNPSRWREQPEALLPETEQYLAIMESPPPALIEAVSGIRQRATYGRQHLNIPGAAAPKRVTSALVFEVMGLATNKRRLVKRQLEALAVEVAAQ